MNTLLTYSYGGNMYMRKNDKIMLKLFFGFSVLFLILSLFIYALDVILIPNIMIVAEGKMKAKASEILNRNALLIFNESFDYNDLIKVEKNQEGYITLVRSNTMRMNRLAAEIALKSQKELQEEGSLGIQFPIGYISKNNLLANFGPKVTVRMEPIEYISTSYDSTFESAGINQTRHRIFLNMIVTMKLIIPFKNSEVKYSYEIPVTDTIIVGKIPRTVLELEKGELK